jgi:hypothetical protein
VLDDAIAQIDGKATVTQLEDVVEKQITPLKHRLRDVESRCVRGLEFEVKPHTNTTDRECESYSEASSWLPG